MGYKTRVTWECEFTEQKRAYADTTTEGRLIVEFYTDYASEWAPFDINDEQAKRMLKGVVGFSEPGEESDPFSPVLRTFQKVDKGIWYVFVVSRYND